MTKQEQERDAYNAGVKDAKSGVTYAEGSRRYKNNKELLPIYAKGFIAGRNGGAYA